MEGREGSLSVCNRVNKGARPHTKLSSGFSLFFVICAEIESALKSHCFMEISEKTNNEMTIGAGACI